MTATITIVIVSLLWAALFGILWIATVKGMPPLPSGWWRLQVSALQLDLDGDPETLDANLDNNVITYAFVLILGLTFLRTATLGVLAVTSLLGLSRLSWSLIVVTWTDAGASLLFVSLFVLIAVYWEAILEIANEREAERQGQGSIGRRLFRPWRMFKLPAVIDVATEVVDLLDPSTRNRDAQEALEEFRRTTLLLWSVPTLVAIVGFVWPTTIVESNWSLLVNRSWIAVATTMCALMLVQLSRTSQILVRKTQRLQRLLRRLQPFIRVVSKFQRATNRLTACCCCIFTKKNSGDAETNSNSNLSDDAQLQLLIAGVLAVVGLVCARAVIEIVGVLLVLIGFFWSSLSGLEGIAPLVSHWYWEDYTELKFAIELVLAGGVLYGLLVATDSPLLMDDDNTSDSTTTRGRDGSYTSLPGVSIADALGDTAQAVKTKVARGTKQAKKAAQSALKNTKTAVRNTKSAVQKTSTQLQTTKQKVTQAVQTTTKKSKTSKNNNNNNNNRRGGGKR